MKTMCKLTFAAILTAGLLLAQGDKTAAPASEPEFFRLDFVLKDVENGKVVNSRNYSTLMAAGTRDPASIRTSTRVPMPTGQVEVGVNIDCSLMRRLQNGLTMFVTAEVNTVVLPQDKGSSLGPQVRKNRCYSPVVVPIGKPTVLFSSDDLASTRTLQLELTATPVK